MTNIAHILGEEMPMLTRQRKGNAVYHAVKRAIVLRTLDAGTALVEQQIAGAMGCSQGTVREALLRLEQDGLVARRGYQGTVVSDTSAAEAAQMARIRIDIECEGIRRATRACDDEALDRLKEIVAQMETAESTGDAYDLSELDRQFHITLFRLADLEALEPVLMRCALHMHRFTFGDHAGSLRLADTPPLPSAGDQHRILMDALRAGDPDAAATAMRAHIETVIGYWSPRLREAMAHSAGPV